MTDKLSDSMRCFSDWVKAGQAANTTGDTVSTPNKHNHNDMKVIFSQTVVMGGTTPFAQEKRHGGVIERPTLKHPRSDPSTTATIDSNQNNNKNPTPSFNPRQTQLPIQSRDAPTTQSKPTTTTTTGTAATGTAVINFSKSTTPPSSPTKTAAAPAPAPPRRQVSFAVDVPNNKNNKNNTNKNDSGVGGLARTVTNPPTLKPSAATTTTTAGSHSRIAALESQLAASEEAQTLGMNKIRELLLKVKETEEKAGREKAEVICAAEEELRKAREKEMALWGAIERRDGKVKELAMGGGGVGGAGVGGATGAGGEEVEKLKEEVEKLKGENAKLKEENGELKAEGEKAKAWEEKSVEKFDALRKYAMEMEAKAEKAEKVTKEVHKLGQEQWERAEKLQEQYEREREARAETWNWGMKWKKQVDQRERAEGGTQHIKEAVFDRMYNNLCDILEDCRKDRLAREAELAKQN
ncbi:uncharacterized protein BKCO1_3000191 [Diplodia corticola]|uniref:Uncharacterized protein n=1 Tax=Diplodia corticola TaxID=236234 RepID=A0A1J9RFW9_9PEZI|nr:uncharacterized protein BKCO1_3000191 [Diplodia corticola]OJD38978.1 hypothetical protein BKCO1_3000191 [Diplodia corticola]